jgi:hypothetical protein
MIKMLRIILIISSISSILGSITKFELSTPSLLGIAFNLVVFIFVWKLLDVLSKNLGVQNISLYTKITKWIVLVYFSIFAIQMGILVAFLLRFFTDRLISDGVAMEQLWAITLKNSGIYNEILITLIPLMVSLPLLYLLCKWLKFSKPILPASITFIIWEILLHLPKIAGIK